MSMSDSASTYEDDVLVMLGDGIVHFRANEAVALWLEAGESARESESESGEVRGEWKERSSWP